MKLAKVTLRILILIGTLHFSAPGVSVAAAAPKGGEPINLRLCENLPLWRLLLLGETADQKVFEEVQAKTAGQKVVIGNVSTRLSFQYGVFVVSTGFSGLLVFGGGGAGAAFFGETLWAGLTLTGMFSPPKEANNNMSADLLSRDLRKQKKAVLEVVRSLNAKAPEDTVLGALNSELMQNDSGRQFTDLFGGVLAFHFRYDTGRIIQFWTMKSETGERFQFDVISQKSGDLETFTFIGSKIKQLSKNDRYESVEAMSTFVESEPSAFVNLDIGINQAPSRDGYCTAPKEGESKKP